MNVGFLTVGAEDKGNPEEANQRESVFVSEHGAILSRGCLLNAGPGLILVDLIDCYIFSAVYHMARVEVNNFSFNRSEDNI